MAKNNQAGNRRRKRRKKSRIKVYIARLIVALVCLTVIAMIGFGGYKLYSKFSEGFSKSEVVTDESNITISSKGVITGSIVEDFDSQLYSEADLSSLIDKEVAEYNALSGEEDSVLLKKYEIKNNKAYVVFDYRTDADYRGFNGLKFYAGTVKEVTSDGVLFDKMLKGYDGESDLVAGNTSIISDMKCVVLSESVAVSLPGKIKYCSENVSVVDKKNAKVNIGEDSALAYIVYK